MGLLIDKPFMKLMTRFESHVHWTSTLISRSRKNENAWVLTHHPALCCLNDVKIWSCDFVNSRSTTDARRNHHAFLISILLHCMIILQIKIKIYLFILTWIHCTLFLWLGTASCISPKCPKYQNGKSRSVFIHTLVAIPRSVQIDFLFYIMLSSKFLCVILRSQQNGLGCQQGCYFVSERGSSASGFLTSNVLIQLKPVYHQSFL